MSTLPSNWIETALRVTGHFEDSMEPLAGVSGDFDGMGISLGVLQWNIGSGSLQPLVKAVGRDVVLDRMPVYGGEYWTACAGSIPQGLEIVRAWQHGQQLMRAVLLELKQFALSNEFVNQQILAATRVAEKAWRAASDWNTETGRGDPSLKEFCWFFDLYTQNGGLKDVSPSNVDEFIQASGIDRADDVVCDWLASRTKEDNGWRDSIRNALMWRDNVSEQDLALFVASYLRSQKSKLVWRADVMNRKGTIALGAGWVHGEKQDLTALLG